MKTNVYTQNLEWLKKRVPRFPYLVRDNQEPFGLEPDENNNVLVVPFYHYPIFAFKWWTDQQEYLLRPKTEPFDLATLTKPKA